MKNRIGILLLLVNIIVMLAIGYSAKITFDNLFYTAAEMDRKVELYRIITLKQMEDIKTTVIESAQATLDIDKTQLAADRAQAEAIQNLDEKMYDLMEKVHPIAVANIEQIKEANLLIVNLMRGSGAGAHIRIRNQDYVLSAAHLVKDKEYDMIYAEDNKGKMYPLEVEKIDKKNDLVLFKMNVGCPQLASLEISDETPKAGAETILIGNPDGETDIVTEGVIAKVDENSYTITNLCYFGNSGGPLLYKGKIIGVASQICALADHPPVYVNYGVCIRVEVIREFLKEYLN